MPAAIAAHPSVIFITVLRFAQRPAIIAARTLLEN
jgi:hypothetical protein